MRFFTSDTHFGHQNIIKFCNRPFGSVAEMNEALIDNWNSTVTPDDVVFHLGDVALGPWVEWDSLLTRLNGYKILVVGNHDRIFKGESERQQERFAEHYDKWFDEIHHNYPDCILRDGRVVNLSHFPYEADHMDKARHMEHRLPDHGDVLIHGHTHLDKVISHSDAGTLQIHVGQDAWDYKPVSETQILQLLDDWTSN